MPSSWFDTMCLKGRYTLTDIITILYLPRNHLNAKFLFQFYMIMILLKKNHEEEIRKHKGILVKALEIKNFKLIKIFPSNGKTKSG